MHEEGLERWLTALGYDPASPSLHRASPRLSSRHAYAPELHDLLNPAGDIRAEAVFDVEGTPTISFFVDDGALLKDDARLTALRQRIWNQGLVSVLLVVTPAAATPVPISPRAAVGDPLTFDAARVDGPFSRADVQSGDVRARHESWFRLEDRVDRRLVANLRETVTRLAAVDAGASGKVTRQDAQYLVGQLLFVSYLEHRGIVSDLYRSHRRVDSLHALVARRDRTGLVRLLAQLKRDFNGDFLDSDAGVGALWQRLPPAGFDVLADLLAATDIERRQPSLFPYNFRYIPVELLSGVYESFLGRDQKKSLAAYYTPRHLANLVVDQALSTSPDLLSERIYDGACGSGILLTTAFRRLLGEAEARRGAGPLPLRERIGLLRGHIFGSDLSEAACRVTAFSLYLSLLERLEPADVVALCEDAQVKLPRLRGSNLFGGVEHGDFFSDANPNTQRTDYTLLLSNPPWMETGLDEGASDDERAAAASLARWVGTSGIPRTLNQIAADFAWRASDIAAPGARLCLILPMSLLLKPTSQPFLAAWLERVRWRQLVNFGDLKELLFDDGRLSCAVLLAERRAELPHPDRSVIAPGESFEYWAPKADASLAMGRLTLHGVDRHTVYTRAISVSNRELVTRMWGDEHDLALWTRLRLRGTFGDLWKGRNRRWNKQKGFHHQDASVPQTVSSRPLWNHPFIEPSLLKDALVLDTASEASPFPRQEIPTVSRLSDKLLLGFDGPRILFPDGPSPERSVRAAFVNGPASFKSSVGVIAGPPEDEDLLRFATVYLRSDLVRYFMVTQLYQLLGDRDRVSLSDVAEFPFFTPERHPDPAAAHRIVRATADLTRAIEHQPQLTRDAYWRAHRAEAEQLIEAYFGLEASDQAIVRETVEHLLPRIRPYGLSSVFRLARDRLGEAQAQAYALALQTSLESWRDARGGTGEFQVDVQLTRIDRAGPFGIVRIRAGVRHSRAASATRSDQAVNGVVEELHRAGLLTWPVRESIYFAPDVVLQEGDTVYLIKPQLPRLWLRRQARRDATRVVLATTETSPRPSHVDAA